MLYKIQKGNTMMAKITQYPGNGKISQVYISGLYEIGAAPEFIVLRKDIRDKDFIYSNYRRF